MVVPGILRIDPLPPCYTVDISSNTPVGSLAAGTPVLLCNPAPVPVPHWHIANGSHYRRVSLVSENQRKIKNRLISLDYYSDK